MCSPVHQVLGNITKEIAAGRIVNLDDIWVSDLDRWRHAGKSITTDGSTCNSSLKDNETEHDYENIPRQTRLVMGRPLRRSSALVPAGGMGRMPNKSRFSVNDQISSEGVVVRVPHREHKSWGGLQRTEGRRELSWDL